MDSQIEENVGPTLGIHRALFRPNVVRRCWPSVILLIGLKLDQHVGSMLEPHIHVVAGPTMDQQQLNYTSTVKTFVLDKCCCGPMSARQQ